MTMHNSYEPYTSTLNATVSGANASVVNLGTLDRAGDERWSVIKRLPGSSFRPKGQPAQRLRT